MRKEKLCNKLRVCKCQTIPFSIFTSLLFLIMFLCFQYFDFNALKLDEKWIVVCCLPIIIGLVLKGYISKIKAFDIEVDINNINRNFSLIDYDPNLITEKRHKPKVHENKSETLTFFIGRNIQYNAEHVKNYFNNIRSIKFIQIADRNCKFRYLLSADIFRSDINKTNLLVKFIMDGAIENNMFSQRINLIQDYINVGDNIIDAYKKFQCFQESYIGRKTSSLPILDCNHIMVGTINIQTLESKIINEAVRMYK